MPLVLFKEKRARKDNMVERAYNVEAKDLGSSPGQSLLAV